MNVIIDYTTFPLEVLQRAFYELQQLKAEGFPIDDALISQLRIEIIDRKTGYREVDV